LRGICGNYVEKIGFSNVLWDEAKEKTAKNQSRIQPRIKAQNPPFQPKVQLKRSRRARKECFDRQNLYDVREAF